MPDLATENYFFQMAQGLKHTLCAPNGGRINWEQIMHAG